ncbi:MAG: hypothetical protein E4H44_02845 [Candidatus Aminicenantes bacterium]|nr:MAG: hypothetical protein E4H44_02845 [Candidatus Aminicenantes bacterium]
MGGRTTFLALAVALALTGCSTSAKGLPVRTEYSKTNAFQQWKTFRSASIEFQKQLDSAIWRILVDFPPITG